MPPDIPQLPGLSNMSPLGRGGFADVYLARQAHLDRFVAAKVFRVTLADRAASDQFRAECQAVGRLHGHPNIITVFEANVLPDGRPYIVTEQCDSSLHELVTTRGALPPEQVAQLGRTVAPALLFAHSAGVLHGDVTPQNVLLRATGAPVLADFGLAVLRDYQGNVASGFTLAHAAPETVRYDGAIDERTDVYGLGSTLYTALSGASPFPARTGEPDAARANRILTEKPSEPPGPAWLSDLILAMLAKDPAARPTLAGVADALARGAQAGPTPSRSASVGAPPPWLPHPGSREHSGADTRNRPAPAPPDAGPLDGEATRIRPDPRRPGTPDAPAPRRSRRRLVVGGAVLGVAAVAGGAIWLWPRPDPPVTVAGPGDPGTRIELAAPVDNGATVALRWSAAATLDYAVIIGGPDGAPARSELTGRVTEHTVAVDPTKPYCFRVQGVNETGAVSESNVVALRGAVCRFPNP